MHLLSCSTTVDFLYKFAHTNFLGMKVKVVLNIEGPTYGTISKFILKDNCPVIILNPYSWVSHFKQMLIHFGTLPNKHEVLTSFIIILWLH